MKAFSLKAPNSNVSGRKNLSDYQGKIPAEKVAFLSRLDAAHKNGLEALPLFAGGVVASAVANVSSVTATRICVVHLAARALYNVVYALPPVANGAPRSLMWAITTGTSVGLWILAAGAYSA